MRKLVQATSVFFLALVIGCAHDRPLAVELQQDVKLPERAVVMLFADGVRFETFDALLRAGKLPNIKKHLVDRGTQVRYGLACLPTITYANTVTLLTGQFPGHHGITGNRFFDRYLLLYRNYTVAANYQLVDMEFTAPTVYERLADRHTISIQCAARRGATRTIDNWMTSGLNWFFRQINTIDKLTTIRFELIANAANRMGTWPEFIHAYFPAPDENGHRFGIDSPQYQAAMINLDTQIGRIVDGIERAGMLDRTFFCFVSDHGMTLTPRDNFVNVGSQLREHFGLRVLDKPTNHWDLWVRYEILDAHDAVVMADGSRKAAIYLRYDKTWREMPEDATDVRVYPADDKSAERPTAADLAKHLASLPAVRLAAVRAGANRVRIFAANGSADIERQIHDGRKRYRYQRAASADPVGYDKHAAATKLIDGQYHTRDEWLAATIATDAPDLVGQLPELFDTHRSGEVVLFAAAGWDFSARDISGHGSILPDDIRVPMIFAGPGIPPGGSIPWGRTCDVMPTLLELLGYADRLAEGAPIDGQSLVERIRQAVIP